MSTVAVKRLQAELAELRKDPPPGICGDLRDNNIMTWEVMICGPDHSHWEGGMFKLLIEFNEGYPDQPPAAKFISDMYHPNIFEDGRICLDILEKDNWTPIWSAPFLLVAIQSILCDPYVDSVANFTAARTFVNDRREYDRQVFRIVEKSVEF